MVLIEANYDKNMLQVGPYPYYLKQRILGTKGHLSNENSGQLLRTIFSNRLKYIMLGHLSKENNYPELAYQAVKVEIQEALNSNVKLSVAHRDRPTELVRI
jgi:phosphoribosyl 1,2-cyclic phosphodiesterase